MTDTLNQQALQFAQYPQLPKLHYSTWGHGLYSEHWLTALNCWMYGIVKLVEQNIDLDGDIATLAAFERLCASDHMFVYDDPKQQMLAKTLFIEQYQAVAEQLNFEQREVACYYPIDPFRAIFVYATMDKPATKVQFKVTKSSAGEQDRQVLLDAVATEQAGVQVYYQYFMLQPGQNYRLSLDNSACRVDFTSADFGTPLYIGKGFGLKPKYDLDKLFASLDRIWGNDDVVPVVPDHPDSTPIHSKAALENVLKGKRVAIYKYNKEFYCLGRFAHLAPFDIACVFDDEVALKDSSEYVQGEATDIAVISDADAIEQYAFDAIILTCSLNFPSEVAFFNKLLAVAVKRQIPVVSLYDDVLKYQFCREYAIAEDLFYTIGLSAEDLPVEPIPALPESPANVLAVFGTDSVQGKFTTQLYLRQALGKHIEVAHWATEPTGPLLGADKGYSRLYGGQTQQGRAAFERQALVQMAQSKDLVITGGQNSIIFEPPGKQKQNNASSEIFARFLPRLVVLTVSVDTQPQTVRQAIDYVATLSKKHQIESQVVALAMMGGRKVRGGRWTQTYFLEVEPSLIAAAKQSLSEASDLPVFSVPNEVDGFAEHIIKVLSCDES